MFSQVWRHIKFWWWRVYLFRDSKIKVEFEKKTTWYLEDVAVNNDLKYMMYIGKGYWILIDYTELNIK